MNEPGIKFTKRWNHNLEQYRESARRMDGEQVQYIFQNFPGSKIERARD